MVHQGVNVKGIEIGFAFYDYTVAFLYWRRTPSLPIFLFGWVILRFDLCSFDVLLWRVECDGVKGYAVVCLV
jgi:hypothetical protein